MSRRHLPDRLILREPIDYAGADFARRQEFEEEYSTLTILPDALLSRQLTAEFRIVDTEEFFAKIL